MITLYLLITCYILLEPYRYHPYSTGSEQLGIPGSTACVSQYWSRSVQIFCSDGGPWQASGWAGSGKRTFIESLYSTCPVYLGPITLESRTYCNQSFSIFSIYPNHLNTHCSARPVKSLITAVLLHTSSFLTRSICVIAHILLRHLLLVPYPGISLGAVHLTIMFVPPPGTSHTVFHLCPLSPWSYYPRPWTTSITWSNNFKSSLIFLFDNFSWELLKEWPWKWRSMFAFLWTPF